MEWSEIGVWIFISFFVIAVASILMFAIYQEGKWSQYLEDKKDYMNLLSKYENHITEIKNIENLYREFDDIGDYYNVRARESTESS